MNAPSLRRTPLGDARLAARLRRETGAEIRFDAGSRGRYATDASIYQVEPVGVVIPSSAADVEATLAIAREEGVPLLPRGGGTSQCGQTVNRAIVLDFTKHLRRVLHIDTQARTAEVEPGIVLGHLNAALKPHGLFFPVDPSTHQRCTIGGMAGNNSCGSKSIRYGLMSDNVLAIDALLADGRKARFGAEPDPGVADLTARLHAIGSDNAAEIAARFPRQLRRVGGYNIDALTPEARSQGRGNLARLLVGSEGTLAVSTALTLRLFPIKPRKVLGVVQFPTFQGAMEAARHLVTLDPEAVELVDRNMLDLGRSIPIYARAIERLTPRDPDSLLIVEFHGELDAPLHAKLTDLETMMADLGLPGSVVRVTDPGLQAATAEMREAGLNIMMSMKGDAKPVSFIEDAAVDLDDLPAYTARLTELCDRNGVKATWYAHASVGCLHVRPVLNMKDPADVSRMRAIAEECFALVREYKGSHSGEHGDGIVRSEFHEQMFGSRIVAAFEAVKDAFDPTGLLNPGRIVRAPRMDDRSLFRYRPDYAPLPLTPALDWSAHPGPQSGLLGAVEMCNNNGTCRKFDTGAMCPSYRATRDEEHLTRGRANTLRLALTGQLGSAGLASPEVREAMKLCVSCKACKRECPTGVDMARMKLEVLAQQHRTHGASLRDRLVAHLPRYASWASVLAPLANARNWLPGAAPVLERLAGIAASRPLPAFRMRAFHDAEAQASRPAASRPHAPGEVILFPDTFTRWFEPEIPRAALKLLAASGHRALIPDAGSRPICCGRTYLAAGMIDRARSELRRTLDAIARLPPGLPILGLEPSCLLTLRDEATALGLGAAAADVASRSRLLSEWLVETRPPLPFADPPGPRRAIVHGHCHQKAHGAFDAALDALRLIPGLTVEPIASSCCGMAGAFGYQAETIEVSRSMAELSLLPAIRSAPEGTLVVADGTSCRHQIDDLAHRRPLHGVELLAASLA